MSIFDSFSNLTVIDPVGMKAPNLSKKDRKSWLDVSIGVEFAVICPAQAYPIPTFRYI